MDPEVRRRDPLTVAAMVAAVVFMLVGIGSPLLGRTVFAGTDGLSLTSPYLDDGLAGTAVQNDYLNDTYDALLPSVDLFTGTVSHGSPASWNPYVTGGVPLSATPNYALYSPLMLPHYLLPDWLAPAYTKLLELVVTIIGCVLFLRRIGLGRPAAVLGGVVFASSAFLVMWTNWPQTQVAAMIPWAFWAAEGIVSRRRAVDAVALAGAVAVMLLAGFPAVTAFSLLTVAGYLVTRIVGQRRSQRAGRPLALAGIGVGGALALAAVQLLPFAYFYASWHIDGRAQTPADHLSPAYLVTLFAPWTFGGPSRFDADRPFWYLADNLVEASAYLGAASLVLVVAGVALAGRGRARLPRGVWLFFAVGTGGWLAVIFTALPLHLLVHLPIFSSNFVGRARSVLGFLLAVLAAVGFDVLLRHSPAWRPSAFRSSRWGIAVAAGAVLGVVGLVVKAHGLAADHGPLAVTNADRELLIGLALLAIATAAALTLLMAGSRRVLRAGAAYVLLGLVLVQALSYVGPYWPRVDRDTYYPVTDTHAFLAANLGHERYLGTGAAMFTGTNSAYRLRGLSGHSFINEELAALLAAVPDDAVQAPTQVFLDADPEQAASPVLDRLAGRYLVTSPREPVFGQPRYLNTDGSTLGLAPLRTVMARVPATGPVRAIGFVPAAGPMPAPSPDAWVEVDVRGPDGRVLAHGRRVSVGMTIGSPFLVAVPGDDIPAGTPLTAAITLHAPAGLAIAGVIAAPSTVDGPATMGLGAPPVDVATFVVAGGGDNLKLVYAGSSVIYQRLDALPRIRWASSTVVEPDRDRRVALLASGSLPADEVVLDSPGPAADGRGASVRVISDDPDRIDVEVDAQGGGYLVVADAIQAGWVVSVDGTPAPLVAADQAVVAVAVPAGVHAVEFRYSSPYHGVGGWISLAAVAAAAGVLLMARRRNTTIAEDPQ
jgi:hypothetical protein